MPTPKPKIDLPGGFHCCKFGCKHYKLAKKLVPLSSFEEFNKHRELHKREDRAAAMAAERARLAAAEAAAANNNN